MASEGTKVRRSILGKKLGMTQIFEEGGRWIPVTAVQLGPCTVLQVKTQERDGYEAVQLGFDDRRKAAKQPQQAVLEKLSAAPKRFVREVPFVNPEDLIGANEEDAAARIQAALQRAEDAKAAKAAKVAASGAEEADGDAAEGGDAADEGEAEGEADEEADEGAGLEEVVPGAVVGARVFRGIGRVDVRGVTKGRGFTGTVKRHGFKTGDKSHGSKNVREPGSTGMHTDPGRVMKGKKMPGQYGNANRKVRNLEVVQLNEAENLILIRGAVPGPRGGYLYVEESL